MAFVDLVSIHPYQSPHATSWPVKGHFAASRRDASTTSHEHNNSVAPAPKITASADLENFDWTEYVDLTYPLAMETVGDPYGKLTWGFGETERCV